MIEYLRLHPRENEEFLFTTLVKRKQLTTGDIRKILRVTALRAKLVGVITDGDIRRRLEKNLNPLDGIAKDLMNAHSHTIDLSGFN